MANMQTLEVLSNTQFIEFRKFGQFSILTARHKMRWKNCKKLESSFQKVFHKVQVWVFPKEKKKKKVKKNVKKKNDLLFQGNSGLQVLVLKPWFFFSCQKKLLFTDFVMSMN